MKLFALTIFALISIGLASPVKNLDNDVLIELFNNKIDHESFLVSVNNEVDEETKKLATFFQESLPKLEKIRDGLKADGHEKASMFVAKAIELYKPFVDENVVAEQKTRAKFYAFAAMAIMHLNKKYLEEENSEEALLDGLSFFESEDNEEAHLVSVFAEVDEESKLLAKFFEKTIPKLQKISAGLKKDGKEKASKILDKLIEYYQNLTDEQKVFENKRRARLSAFAVVVIMHANRKYLEDENETIMEALNFIQSENTDLEVVSLDAEVDEESKKLAQFFTESLPKLEKVRDGLKKDGYEKASMIVAKAIELYRPYTTAEHCAANKNQAKFYAFVTIAILHFNQRYLEQ